ncbi:MAG: hypothetical protein HKP61_01245, partial [Dactylosporangium sp.]|nr:hypothetical protein [Dactylosporangium sp.]NNJ59595.1 hypothetical protein [Dactylosporangium sp.]
MGVESPKGTLGPYEFVWNALCALGEAGEAMVSADVNTFDQATGLGATLRDGVSWAGAGEAWPSGNEDQLRELAQLWVRLAGDINEYVQTADTGAMAAQLAWAGPAAEAFGAVWQQIGVSPQAGLPAMMNAAVAFGQGCDAAAMELEYCKLTVIISVYITIFAVFAALISAYWSFGATTAAVPPILAAGRQAVMIAFRQAATQLGRQMVSRQVVKLAARKAATEAIKAISKEAVKQLSKKAISSTLLHQLGRELFEEISEELIIDAGAQAIQRHRGTRTEWDYKRTATAGLGGGLGGLLGVGMHRGFGKLFTKSGPPALQNAAQNLVQDQLQRQVRKSTIQKITDATGKWAKNTLQAGAYNAVISPVSSTLANKMVYGGDWKIPDAEAFLGGFMGGAGRVGMTSVSSVAGNAMANADLNSICNDAFVQSFDDVYKTSALAAGVDLDGLRPIEDFLKEHGIPLKPFAGQSWSSVDFNPLRDFGQDTTFTGPTAGGFGFDSSSSDGSPGSDHGGSADQGGSDQDSGGQIGGLPGATGSGSHSTGPSTEHSSGGQSTRTTGTNSAQSQQQSSDQKTSHTVDMTVTDGDGRTLFSDPSEITVSEAVVSEAVVSEAVESDVSRTTSGTDHSVGWVEDSASKSSEATTTPAVVPVGNLTSGTLAGGADTSVTQGMRDPTSVTDKVVESSDKKTPKTAQATPGEKDENEEDEKKDPKAKDSGLVRDGHSGSIVLTPSTSETTLPQLEQQTHATGSASEQGDTSDPGVVEHSSDSLGQSDTNTGLVPASAHDQQTLASSFPVDDQGQPLRHADPSVGGWLQLINGLGITEEGRYNNCSEAARAFLASWYGTPTVASSVAPGLLSEPDALGRDQARFGAEYTPEGTGVQGYDAVISRLEQTGHGASAVIVTQWTAEAGGGAHTWAAVNHNGSIIFVDAQTGTVTTYGPIYTDSVAGVWSIVLDARGTALTIRQNASTKTSAAGEAQVELPATATGPDASNTTRTSQQAPLDHTNDLGEEGTGGPEIDAAQLTRDAKARAVEAAAKAKIAKKELARATKIAKKAKKQYEVAAKAAEVAKKQYAKAAEVAVAGSAESGILPDTTPEEAATATHQVARAAARVRIAKDLEATTEAELSQAHAALERAKTESAKATWQDLLAADEASRVARVGTSATTHQEDQHRRVVLPSALKELNKQDEGSRSSPDGRPYAAPGAVLTFARAIVQDLTKYIIGVSDITAVGDGLYQATRTDGSAVQFRLESRSLTGEQLTDVASNAEGIATITISETATSAAVETGLASAIAEMTATDQVSSTSDPKVKALAPGQVAELLVAAGHVNSSDDPSIWSRRKSLRRFQALLDRFRLRPERLIFHDTVRDFNMVMERLGLIDGMLGSDQRFNALTPAVQTIVSKTLRHCHHNVVDSIWVPDSPDSIRPSWMHPLKTIVFQQVIANLIAKAAIIAAIWFAFGSADGVIIVSGLTATTTVLGGPVKWVTGHLFFANLQRFIHFSQRADAAGQPDALSKNANKLAQHIQDATDSDTSGAVDHLRSSVPRLLDELSQQRGRRHLVTGSVPHALAQNQSSEAQSTDEATASSSTEFDLSAREQGLFTRLRLLAMQHDSANPLARGRTARDIRALLRRLGLSDDTTGFADRRTLLPADLQIVAERFGRSGRVKLWWREAKRTILDRHPAEDGFPEVRPPHPAISIDAFQSFAVAATVACMAHFVCHNLSYGAFGIAGSIGAGVAAALITPIMNKKRAAAIQLREDWNANNLWSSQPDLATEVFGEIKHPLERLAVRRGEIERRVADLTKRLANLLQRVAGEHGRRIELSQLVTMPTAPVTTGSITSTQATVGEQTVEQAATDAPVATPRETMGLTDAESQALETLRGLWTDYAAAGRLSRPAIVRAIQRQLRSLGLDTASHQYQENLAKVPNDIRRIAERFGDVRSFSCAERNAITKMREFSKLVAEERIVPGKLPRFGFSIASGASQWLGMMGLALLVDRVGDGIVHLIRVPVETLVYYVRDLFDQKPQMRQVHAVEQWLMNHQVPGMPTATTSLAEAGHGTADAINQQVSTTIDQLLASVGVVNQITATLESEQFRAGLAGILITEALGRMGIATARDLAIAEQDTVDTNGFSRGVAVRQLYALLGRLDLHQDMQGGSEQLSSLSEASRLVLARAALVNSLGIARPPGLMAFQRSTDVPPGTTRTRSGLIVPIDTFNASRHSFVRGAATGEQASVPSAAEFVAVKSGDLVLSRVLVTVAEQVYQADTWHREQALLELMALIDLLGLRQDMLGSATRVSALSKAAQRVVAEHGVPLAQRDAHVKSVRKADRKAKELMAKIEGPNFLDRIASGLGLIGLVGVDSSVTDPKAQDLLEGWKQSSRTLQPTDTARLPLDSRYKSGFFRPKNIPSLSSYIATSSIIGAISGIPGTVAHVLTKNGEWAVIGGAAAASVFLSGPIMYLAEKYTTGGVDMRDARIKKRHDEHTTITSLLEVLTSIDPVLGKLGRTQAHLQQILSEAEQNLASLEALLAHEQDRRLESGDTIVLDGPATDEASAKDYLQPDNITPRDLERFDTIRSLAAEYASTRDPEIRRRVRRAMDDLLHECGLDRDTPDANLRWGILPRDVVRHLLASGPTSIDRHAVFTVLKKSGQHLSQPQQAQLADYIKHLLDDSNKPLSRDALVVALDELATTIPLTPSAVPRLSMFAGQIRYLTQNNVDFISEIDPELGARIGRDGIYFDLTGTANLTPYATTDFAPVNIKVTSHPVGLGTKADRRARIKADQEWCKIAFEDQFRGLEDDERVRRIAVLGTHTFVYAAGNLHQMVLVRNAVLDTVTEMVPSADIATADPVADIDILHLNPAAVQDIATLHILRSKLESGASLSIDVKPAGILNPTQMKAVQRHGLVPGRTYEIVRVSRGLAGARIELRNTWGHSHPLKRVSIRTLITLCNPEVTTSTSESVELGGTDQRSTDQELVDQQPTDPQDAPRQDETAVHDEPISTEQEGLWQTTDQRQDTGFVPPQEAKFLDYAEHLPGALPNTRYGQTELDATIAGLAAETPWIPPVTPPITLFAGTIQHLSTATLALIGHLNPSLAARLTNGIYIDLHGNPDLAQYTLKHEKLGPITIPGPRSIYDLHTTTNQLAQLTADQKLCEAAFRARHADSPDIRKLLDTHSFIYVANSANQMALVPNLLLDALSTLVPTTDGPTTWNQQQLATIVRTLAAEHASQTDPQHRERIRRHLTTLLDNLGLRTGLSEPNSPWKSLPDDVVSHLYALGLPPLTTNMVHTTHTTGTDSTPGITAKGIPGTRFHGYFTAEPDPDGVRTTATRAMSQIMDDLLAGKIRRITNLDNGVFEVRPVKGKAFTVALDSDQLSENVVARTTQTDASGYQVVLSSRIDPSQIPAALAHELREVLALRSGSAASRFKSLVSSVLGRSSTDATTDMLTDSDRLPTGTQLSAHDHGNLGHLDVLAHIWQNLSDLDTSTGQHLWPRTRAIFEAAALAHQLGIGHANPGAETRRQRIRTEHGLSDAAWDLLDLLDATTEATTDVDRTIVQTANDLAARPPTTSDPAALHQAWTNALTDITAQHPDARFQTDSDYRRAHLNDLIVENQEQADSAETEARIKRAFAEEFEGRNYGVLGVQVNSVTLKPSFTTVDMSITHPNDGPVGFVELNFSRDSDGRLIRKPGDIEIYPESRRRGTGFFPKFSANLENWCVESNVAELQVWASKQVGRYAQATQGYGWDSRYGSEEAWNCLIALQFQRGLMAGAIEQLNGSGTTSSTTNSLLSILTVFGYELMDPTIVVQSMQRQIAVTDALLKRAGSLVHRRDFKFGQEGFPTPYEISQCGRQTGEHAPTTWLGKLGMLLVDWHGVKQPQARPKVPRSDNSVLFARNDLAALLDSDITAKGIPGTRFHGYFTEKA